MRSWPVEVSVGTGLAPSSVASGDAASRVSTGNLVASDPSRLGEGCGRSEDGQPDFKRSPAFGPVVASDLSLVVLDHTIRRAQSETGAFADWLGGVEGIENALGIAQAGAVVGELHDHFVALAPQANLETPAAGFLQCVHGVFDNLKKGLQELVGIAFHGQADPLVFKLESFHLHRALQKRLQFDRAFFSWSLLREAEQIADQFASAPRLLSDFLRVRELLAAEVAAGGHAFRVGEDGRERELQFAGSQRNQFSERSQLGLLDHSSLQTLQAVEAPARMLEQP